MCVFNHSVEGFVSTTIIFAPRTSWLCSEISTCACLIIRLRDLCKLQSSLHPARVEPRAWPAQLGPLWRDLLDSGMSSGVSILCTGILVQQHSFGKWAARLPQGPWLQAHGPIGRKGPMSPQAPCRNSVENLQNYINNYTIWWGKNTEIHIFNMICFMKSAQLPQCNC